MNNYIVKIAIAALALNLVSCQSDVPDLQTDIAHDQATQFISRSSSENYFPDGWQNFRTHEEKVAALQLPEDLLESMSTEELVEVCMNYPLALDCFAFNSIEYGMQNVISYFNGFAELKSRENAIDKVIDFYNRKLYEIGLLGNTAGYLFKPLKLSFYEQFIISGYLIPANQLKSSEKFNQCVEKANTLRESYIELQGEVATETFTQIKKVVGSMTSRTPVGVSYTTIYTPNGLPVEARIHICGNPDAERLEGIQKIKDEYKDDVEILDDATCTYNCHAYAWYISEGGERCWINQTDRSGNNSITKFISDGTYKETKADYAQKVFYSAGDHSAIAETQSTYISKWGKLPLVRHNKYVCPYNKSAFRYFTKDFTAPSINDPEPDPEPDPIPDDPEFKTGTVYWNMVPDPTPIGSHEDFSISDIYDSRYYRVKVFVSTPKDPSEPMTDTSRAYVMSNTDRTATVYFAARGIYHVCFYVYSKTTGKCIAEYTSCEIYVE